MASVGPLLVPGRSSADQPYTLNCEEPAKASCVGLSAHYRRPSASATPGEVYDEAFVNQTGAGLVANPQDRRCRITRR
jgi:hypothetical protein